MNYKALQIKAVRTGLRVFTSKALIINDLTEWRLNLYNRLYKK